MQLDYKKLIIIALLLLGFAARLDVTDWNKKLIGDEIGYDKSVRQLINEGIYGYMPYTYSNEPNAFTTPGYTTFLTLCYLVFGFDGTHSPIVQIQFIQLLLSLLSAVMIYLIANSLLQNSTIALFLMAIFLFHPTSVYSAAFLLSESLYVLLYLLFIYFMVKLVENGFTARNAVIAGVIFGTCVLVRPAVFPFLILFAIYLLVIGWKSGSRKIVRSLLIMIVCFSAIMTPWVVRNYITLDRVVFLAEQGGNPLLWGTYPFNIRPNIDVTQDPDAMQQMAIGRIKNGFKNEPQLYISWYTWGKTWYLIKDIWPGSNPISNIPDVKYIHYAIAFIGFLGMLLMLFNFRRPAIFSTALIGWISFGVYLPFAPTTRYFYSVLPICILGIGYLLYLITGIWDNSFAPRRRGDNYL
jgi:4-amino-4-deoxy-L-arabinose transferase-like glycosyltransferase